MVRFGIDDETELRLLKERHAEELFALMNQNRKYLREWLPWLETNKSLEDTKEFIKGSLEQFVNNNGFQLGIWFRVDWWGVIGYHKIDWVNPSDKRRLLVGSFFSRKRVND